MYEAPVSAFCAGEHVVCVASTQDEKYTETEDQKRPEKKTVCMQTAGYLRVCLGGKVEREMQTVFLMRSRIQGLNR